MREISVDRTIEAPPAAVWKVLADFPNIADWNGGVKKSFATSDDTAGVGATRHCDLAPFGELEETVTEWKPESLLTIKIESAAKLPIESGLVNFTLAGGDGGTEVGVDYAYEPKGPLGKLVGPLLDWQLSKGFKGFLEDLEAAAKQPVAD